MRTLLTALLVLWLLAGCSPAPQTHGADTTTQDAFLEVCPDVMREIGRYHENFDLLMDTDDYGYVAEIRHAVIRMSAFSVLAASRVPDPGALEGQWLIDLGVSALEFHEATAPGSTPVDQVRAHRALTHNIIRAEVQCAKVAL